ncbi:MAG: diacylglycerol kinase family lipid kinase [Bryobacteraceae bacterium]
MPPDFASQRFNVFRHATLHDPTTGAHGNVTLIFLTPFIYNPTAGRLVRNPGLLERVLAELRPRAADLRPTPTTRPREATEIAARFAGQGVSMVIAAGGDGTINEVANGLAGSATSLTIVPMGTANVLACEMGLSRDPLRAAREVSALEPRRISLGSIRNSHGEARHFLLMAGAGLDARVNGRVRPDIKRRFGKLAYWLAGAEMVGRRLAQIEARAEGRTFRTGFALAARVRNYGGDLAIASKASLLSDRFELVTFRGETSWPYPLYLGGALLGRASAVPGVESVFTRRVELAPVNGSGVEIQIDGEQAGSLPATLEIVTEALTLMVPSRYARREQDR